MKSFVVALLACMAGISPAIAAEFEIPDLRYLIAYTGDNFTGSHSEFLDSVPDLSVYSMDNVIKSICLTGFWSLFNETNYEGTALRAFVGINVCNILPLEDSNQISSVRYSGGAHGINDVYYNLYENEGYGGLKFKGNTNAPSVEPLDLAVSSLVISGQSPWTFFTGLGYTGLAVCVYPTAHYSGEHDIEMSHYHAYRMDYLDLPDNSIRSVARGCLSERIVRLPPSEASLRPEGDHKLTNNAH